MKKTMIAMLAFAFLLGAMGVSAQGKKDSKFNKPSQAKNVQVFKKKALTENEKKSVDELEKAIKGKPAKPTPTPDPTAGGATGTVGDPIPAGGEKYAILIGLANYPGTVNDLCVAAAKTGYDYPEERFTENELPYYCKDEDALNMKKALVDKYGYKNDRQHIFIFSDANAKYDSIKAKVDELIQTRLTENDELVFFFSGHGTTGIYTDDAGNTINDESLDEGIVIYDQSYDEAAFLNGVSYTPSDASYIWDDQLKEWLSNSPTSRIFFGFDTCKAGGMNDLQSDGRVLAMSSTETQNSWTYYLGGTQTDTNVFQESEGLFAHYFVKRAMIDGLGDGFNPLGRRSVNPPKYDGKVAIEEAFNYACSIVKTKQIPVLNDKFFNDLLLGYQIN
ncbi:MAG: caspase family protein [Patescibacteria group bacterium]|nr:caspase family protein [Patescibacteria group bacterium]